MKRYPPSQEEVIEAFLKWLNVQRGAAYTISQRPDETERRQPDIDYVLRDGNTGHEIGVEVSSAWRSDDAGREDHDWAEWTERVREVVRGKVMGRFHVYTPLKAPRGLDPETFARALATLIGQESAKLASRSRDSKGLPARICGMDVFVVQAAEQGSDVEFARDGTDIRAGKFTAFLGAVLGRKSPKLKLYKDRGLETWLLLYDTIWPLHSPTDIERLVRSAITKGHSHIDHIGVVAGNPPDDAWVHVVSNEH